MKKPHKPAEELLSVHVWVATVLDEHERVVDVGSVLGYLPVEVDQLISAQTIWCLQPILH